MTGLVAVILIFSVPIIKILTGHFQEKAEIKLKTINKELELEKIKHENFLLETEKMKIELEKMRIESSHKDSEWNIK